MLLLDYTRVFPFAECLLAFGAGLLCWHVVYRKRKLIRIPTQVISLLLIGSSTLLFLMFGCGELWDSTTLSDPLYSPDGKVAIRVKLVSGGALGGWENILLFSHHGMLVNTVFIGDYNQVKLEDITWKNDHSIEFRYEEGWIHPPQCSNTRAITVTCQVVPLNHSRK